MNKEKLLELMVSAALHAGKAILEVYANPENDVTLKPDNSPLTEADRRADRIIARILAETGIPILSEESVHESWEARQHWDQCFIVDPLDGTKEFISRNGEFTVNIAWVLKGIPEMGVIFAPVTGELYFGVTGAGAFKVLAEEIVTGPKAVQQAIASALALAAPKRPEGEYVVVASRSHRNSETDAFIDSLREDGRELKILSRGSSLKICMVAEGTADVYPRFAPTMEWDTAAGQAIATAAGCRVVDTDAGAPLTYNKQNLLNPWFIVWAGNPGK